MAGRGGGFVPSAPGCYAIEDGQRGSSGSHDTSSTLFALQLSLLSIYEAWRRREHVPDIVTMPTKSRHINCMWGQELAKPFFSFELTFQLPWCPVTRLPAAQTTWRSCHGNGKASLYLPHPVLFPSVLTIQLHGTVIFSFIKKKITTSQEKHQPKTK